MDGLLSLDGSLRELDDLRATRKSQELKNAVPQVCLVYLNVPVSQLVENTYDDSISHALFAFRLKVGDATSEVLDKLAEDFCVSALRYDSEYARTAMELKTQLLQQVGGANLQYTHQPKTVCYTAEQTRRFMRLRALQREAHALSLVNSWRESVIQQIDQPSSRPAQQQAVDKPTARQKHGDSSGAMSKARREQIERLNERQLVVSQALSRIQATNQSTKLEIEHVEAKQSKKLDSFEKVQPLRRISSQPRLVCYQAMDPPVEPPKQPSKPKQPKSTKYTPQAEQLNEIADQLFKIEKCTSLAQINARNRRFALQLFRSASQNDEISELDCLQLAEVIKNPLVKKRLQQLGGEAGKQQKLMDEARQQQKRRKSVTYRFIKREDFISTLSDKIM